MATQLAPAAVEPADTGQDIDTGAEPQSGERDYEDEARQRGWVSPEEFKGDKTRCIDAKTFVERSDVMMPLLRKENKQFRDKISFLERQVKRVMASEQNAHANALAQIKAQMADAVVTGDVAAFNALDKRADQLRQDMADDTPGQSGEDPATVFESFRDSNAWYDKAALASAREDEVEARLYADKRLRQFAREAQTENLAPAALFDRVQSDFARLETEIGERFPMLKSKAPRAKPASDVAGVTNGSGARKAKTGANLPAEAKEAAARYVKQGIPGYKGKTMAEALEIFAKSYDWS